jgi:hypothetical protein
MDLSPREQTTLLKGKYSLLTDSYNSKRKKKPEKGYTKVTGVGGIDLSVKNKEGIQIEYVNTQIDKYEELLKALTEVESAGNAINNTFSSMGDAIGGSAGEALKSFGEISSGISTLIPQIMALTNAEFINAIAGASASGAKLPFPANLAAIASGVAAVMAALATTTKVAGSVGKFADGGIVSGSSYHGDSIYARVNSGEMILNSDQQSRLFNMLDSGRAAGGGVVVLDTRIKGSDLILMQKNYNNKMSKL